MENYLILYNTTEIEIEDKPLGIFKYKLIIAPLNYLILKSIR